jgi:hypothetical protein
MALNGLWSFPGKKLVALLETDAENPGISNHVSEDQIAFRKT